MKKLLFIAFLLMCSIYSFAQLTEGKYKVLGVKGFLNNETVFDNLFEDGIATINVTNNIVNITIGGYSVLSYSIEKPAKNGDLYLYNAFEIQSGIKTTLLSKRDKEHPQIDGGMLFVRRSDEYTDIFFISKED